MRSDKLIIAGMSCNHCVMTLKKELSKLNLKVLDVQIGSAQIEYNETKTTYLQIETAVKEAGFSIKNSTDA